MDVVRRYFTEREKIFTTYATITDGYISSVFYRELQNIYCICHAHWQNYSVGDLPLEIQTELFRRYISSCNFFFVRAFSFCKTISFLFFIYRQNVELPMNVMPTDIVHQGISQ